MFQYRDTQFYGNPYMYFNQLESKFTQIFLDPLRPGKEEFISRSANIFHKEKSEAIPVTDR
jgi:hypothetical protein